MRRLNIDFETRSTVKLNQTGVYPYAQHPDTDLWCMAYALDGSDVYLWTPGDPVPPIFAAALERDDVQFRAWNANFERIIWREILGPRYGFPVPPLERWHCTMVEAMALALPASLGQAAKVLKTSEKDHDGRRLMLRMAKPRKVEADGTIVWWDVEEKKEKLFEYCRQDVRVEREIGEKLLPLSGHEREVYLLDQRMNDRGVMIDVPLVKAAQGIVAEGKKRANAELAEVTDGEVTKVTKPTALKVWLQGQGVDIDNVQKATLRDVLEGELEDDVERAIELRLETAKSSTAKLNAMFRYACEDWRARGLLQYHGAATGRWAGRGIQPQNMTRPEFNQRQIEWMIPFVLAGDYAALEREGPPTEIVASILRACIRSRPGHRFLCGDFGQVEARVLAWIAEQEDLVRAFAAGAKIYEDMGAAYSGKPIEEITKDSEERQVGKNSVLGCGFQMGADTFALQVWEQTGIVLDRGERDEDGKLLEGEVDEAQRIIDVYRGKYARIPEFWYAINDAAKAAVARPGIVTSVGRGGAIKYTVRGQFLWCVLPSKRLLAYAKPKLKRHTVRPKNKEPFTTISLSYMGVNSYNNKWQREFTYGGKLTENVVQAMARDLLASAMLRLEEHGYPNVLTVHDEAVTELPYGEGSLDEMLALMKMRPQWAEGLPVAVDGWEGERYRK